MVQINLRCRLSMVPGIILQEIQLAEIVSYETYQFKIRSKIKMKFILN